MQILICLIRSFVCCRLLHISRMSLDVLLRVCPFDVKCVTKSFVSQSILFVLDVRSVDTVHLNSLKYTKNSAPSTRVRQWPMDSISGSFYLSKQEFEILQGTYCCTWEQHCWQWIAAAARLCLFETWKKIMKDCFQRPVENKITKNNANAQGSRSLYSRYLRAHTPRSRIARAPLARADSFIARRHDTHRASFDVIEMWMEYMETEYSNVQRFSRSLYLPFVPPRIVFISFASFYFSAGAAFAILALNMRAIQCACHLFGFDYIMPWKCFSNFFVFFISFSPGIRLFAE